MNNNKVCPNCRNPMPAQTCKHCGYRQVVLQVVGDQQQFGKFNYFSRIRKTPLLEVTGRQLTQQQKLTIYLKEYQKLIKTAMNRLIQVQDLDCADAQLLRNSVKFIWHLFLKKKVATQTNLYGMFAKSINSKKEDQKKDKREQSVDADKEAHSSKEDEDSREEVYVAKKRGRPMKRQNKNKQLSCLTQLRCYFRVSVSSLITESIQQRKVSPDELTSAQKSFLSYLLGVKQLNPQFLKLASTKYIKLLYSIRNQKIQRSYIKESQIECQVKRRGEIMLKTRQKSIGLVLLVDLMRCWTMAYSESEYEGSLNAMLRQYDSKDEKSVVIDNLIEGVRKVTQKQEDFNLPSYSYELIYAIIYVAVVQVGATLSLGEVITSCGRLQIDKIQVEEQLFLPGVPNEQAISVKRTRKTAHLLSRSLEMKFPNMMKNWNIKWCKKLKLEQYFSILQNITSKLFPKACSKIDKNIEDQEGQQHFKSKYYHRYWQLQQDIASMAGIIVLIKLIHGSTDYPFLYQFPLQEIQKQYEIESEEFELLKQLIKNKQITVKKKDSQEKITKIIPYFYQKPFPMMDFLKRIQKINEDDKYLGYNTFNEQFIRLRNLADLNDVSAGSMIQFFEKRREERHSQGGQQIKLRYAEIQHVQWINQLKKKRAVNQRAGKSQQQKKKVGLSQDIKNQLSCIIESDEQFCPGQFQQKKECLLDFPSSNYELMYEYTGENLKLVQRQELLFIMQELSFNFCTYNQLTQWKKAFESILKQFQAK